MPWVCISVQRGPMLHSKVRGQGQAQARRRLASLVGPRAAKQDFGEQAAILDTSFCLGGGWGGGVGPHGILTHFFKGKTFFISFNPLIEKQNKTIVFHFHFPRGV